MRFQRELEQATLIRRYNRFLADVRLSDGRQLTIHCPNSGSMRSCSTPGSRVCYSRSENPKRKFPHTLEMVHNGDSWVGVNTVRTNRIVVEALREGRIGQLGDFDTLSSEVQTSVGNRLDIMLTKGERKTYIEVKNCSLVESGCALFPDAVTARGTKHLLELARLVEEGHEAVIFYLVQRLDADRFSPAASIDPLYAETLQSVIRQGVKALAYQAAVTPESIEVGRELPVSINL